MDDAMTECPTCHAAVGDSEQFCEACGAGLNPSVAATEPSPQEAPTQPMPNDLDRTAATCQVCGAEVSSDGYCGTCGVRAPTLRDHFSEHPAAWVAAVC